MTDCHNDKFEVYNGDCEVVIDYLTVAQLTQGNKYAEEILNDLNVRQLKTNRYGSQRRKRYNTMGALDKAMYILIWTRFDLIVGISMK